MDLVKLAIGADADVQVKFEGGCLVVVFSLQAKKEIEAEIEARKQASAVIIAEQGRWYTACIRPLFAAPFIIFAWKIVVWDKVLKLGSTDPLDPNMWSVFLTVVGAYFGDSALFTVLKEGLQIKTGETPGGLQMWLTGVGSFGAGVGDLRRGGAINILQNS